MNWAIIDADLNIRCSISSVRLYIDSHKMFSFLNRQVHDSRSRWRKKYVFKKPSYTPNWLINRGSVLSYIEKHKVGGSAANFKGQYIGNKKRRNYLAAPTIKPTFILRFKYLLTYIFQKYPILLKETIEQTWNSDRNF